ncbi:MAG: hypothetical protein SVV03_03135 [Candidatus Nanohaloarchaea archaeon]|nr:hypothetical protein [Candidatus Nanohaloarchaea archaeon]
MRRLAVIAALATAIAFFSLGGSLQFLDISKYTSPEVGEYGSAHKHLYFKISILNRTLDLSRDRFQMRSDLVHLENGNGEIVHVHAENVYLDFFLQTLDMGLSQSCVALKSSFCTNKTHELRIYINGEVVESPGDYILKQDDNIVLWYGKKDREPDRRFFDRELPRQYRPESKKRNI